MIGMKVYTRKGLQATLTGDVLEVFSSMAEDEAMGKCDIKCLRATHPECRCRCSGRNHGYLTRKANSTLDDDERYIWLGHIPEIAKMFDDYVCPTCGTSFKYADILGYPHPDGIYVENYGMKLWVFARCSKCGYDCAWWKLGRSKLTTPEGWK
jgi:hypothetical protein